MIPYGWWQFATIEFAGPGAGAASQLTAAASEDKPYLVKVLMGRGTRVDIRDSYGKTALEEACRTEHRSIADYLIGQNADLNYAPSCRKYREFATRMKPEAPAIPPDDGLPKIPETTIEVH
jgi:ankyrin repeat protein